MDEKKIQEGVRLILEGIGEDCTREGLLETPDRIARMYQEIFGGKCSLNDCIDALAKVVKEAERQRQALADKRMQYSPSRVQRRHG